jgi:hypothetical protein
MLMKKNIYIGVLALMVSITIFILTTSSALAHEKRLVDNKYTFVVGFLDEPAYAEVKNSLDLTICDGKQCNYAVTDGQRVVSNPVNDADKTLQVEVSMGGSTPLSLTLEPRWANPGKYNAFFMPTKTGDYTFHIHGTLHNDTIDEKFTSSPTGFSAVEAVKVYPVSAADQSQQNSSQVTALQEQVKNAQESAHTATTLGIAGLVIGALGLLAAGFALARRPRLSTPPPQETKTSAESLRG